MVEKAIKRLAVNSKGQMTYCSVPEELRGIGRCNHTGHQADGESPAEFIERISNQVATDDENVQDQKYASMYLVTNYGGVYVDENGRARNPEPDIRKIIEESDNPFVFGSGEDKTEAKLVNFTQERIEDPLGDKYHMIAYYEYDGVTLPFDLGEIPAIAEDGTFTINGSRFRYLPVMDQWKAGVSINSENVIIKDRRDNLAMVINKESGEIKIRGDVVDQELLIEYMRAVAAGEVSPTDDYPGLQPGQRWAINNLDPVVYQRYPKFPGNIDELREAPEDQPGDISWRRCRGYEDYIRRHWELSSRRMGVTFRRNVAEGSNWKERGINPFYNDTMSKNITGDLVGRSNVQLADDSNPIAALSQSQKISLTGPGGYNKDSAPGSLRLPHLSHKGLVDSLDTSSGKNTGLTMTLSGGAINPDGFIVPRSGSTMGPQDFVPMRYNADPNRAIMAVAHIKQAVPIFGGEDPIVSTPAWDSIRGAKLGANMRIAYIPGEGVFEDGVVVSESAARKMGTRQKNEYFPNRPEDLDQMSTLKPGTKFKRGDRVCGVRMRMDGVVTGVGVKSFSTEVEVPFTVGSKLAGRSGNKSVATRIVPDEQMPLIPAEGGAMARAEILMSPLSVGGRKNPSQVFETNQTMGRGERSMAETEIVLSSGERVYATSGKQFIIRLHHDSEAKMSAVGAERNASREFEGSRLGEMESLLLTSSPDRRAVLRYLRHQGRSDTHAKLGHLLRAVGVDLSITDGTPSTRFAPEVATPDLDDFSDLDG